VNFQQIVAELTAERDQIDHAIAAMEGLNSAGRRRAGRPPKAARKPRRRGRMSAAARRKMSRLLKVRWAQGKMGIRSKAKRASKPARRRMSRAARQKIAAAQRARWAKVKAQKQAA
jgi:hypothetical protein